MKFPSREVAHTVAGWLAKRIEVRILTVGPVAYDAKAAIQRWCLDQFGRELKIEDVETIGDIELGFCVLIWPFEEW